MKAKSTAPALLAIIGEAGITRQEAADLLYVSYDTMKSWLAFINPVPLWAVELLQFKVQRTTASADFR